MEYWFTPNKKLTGQAIKKHRVAKGWPAAKLGEALGNYSDRTIYKWENGKSFPALENILKIAYLLDVTGQDILLPKSVCRFSKTDTPCAQYSEYTRYLLQKIAYSWLSGGERSSLDKLKLAGFWDLKNAIDQNVLQSPAKWLEEKMIYEFGPTYKSCLDEKTAKTVMSFLESLVSINTSPTTSNALRAYELSVALENYPKQFKFLKRDLEKASRNWIDRELNLKDSLGWWLEWRGSTPKECAIAIGASESSISQWQSGYSYPKTEKLSLLLSYAGRTVDPYDFVRDARFVTGDYENYYRLLSLLRSSGSEKKQLIADFLSALDVKARECIVYIYENEKQYFNGAVCEDPKLIEQTLKEVWLSLGLATADKSFHDYSWWANTIHALGNQIWSLGSGIIFDGIQGCVFDLIGKNYRLWEYYLRALGSNEIDSLLRRFKDSNCEDRLLYGLLLAAREDAKPQPVGHRCKIDPADLVGLEEVL